MIVCFIGHTWYIVFASKGFILCQRIHSVSNTPSHRIPNHFLNPTKSYLYMFVRLVIIQTLEGGGMFVCICYRKRKLRVIFSSYLICYFCGGSRICQNKPHLRLWQLLEGKWGINIFENSDLLKYIILEITIRF